MMASLRCRHTNSLRALRTLGAHRSAATSRAPPVAAINTSSSASHSRLPSAHYRRIGLLASAPPPMSRLSNENEPFVSAAPIEPLPAAGAAEDTVSPILSRLSAEQQEIVMHSVGPVLVLAGPGTGKTHTIAARVARLVRSGVPASHIVGASHTM
jgi:hypothetical protein